MPIYPYLNLYYTQGFMRGICVQEQHKIVHISPVIKVLHGFSDFFLIKTDPLCCITFLQNISFNKLSYFLKNNIKNKL